MALDAIRERYISRDNNFYREHYHHIMLGMMGLIVFMTLIVVVLLYQMFHRPLPVFEAVQENGQKMLLKPYDQPNLLPDTILRWSNKAATAAYTFSFSTYDRDIIAARPYFTADGWEDYLRSISSLINTIKREQLIVFSVVAGTPVISNQGVLPEKGYVWRVQIPFLVTYVNANTFSNRNYFVVLTIVRVPSDINPQGIGIDQFVMR